MKLIFNSQFDANYFTLWLRNILVIESYSRIPLWVGTWALWEARPPEPTSRPKFLMAAQWIPERYLWIESRTANEPFGVERRTSSCSKRFMPGHRFHWISDFYGLLWKYFINKTRVVWDSWLLYRRIYVTGTNRCQRNYDRLAQLGLNF